MKNFALKVYKLFFIIIPTFFNCKRSGLRFDSSWNIVGKVYVIRRKWYERFFANHSGGSIEIGKKFCCRNLITSNVLGVIQPCVFNIALDNSKIKIGNNVGISGSTINSAISVTIEDNVSIGSGCLITDTDSHPLNYEDRIIDDSSKTSSKAIVIKEGAFIGARSIILKGVVIGKHSIIGAGSVVTKSIPDYSIACGNPAIVVKQLNPIIN